MNLLICTQTVDRDDPILGFFCLWIETYAQVYERVDVICLREGSHALPKNVHVHVLPKNRISRVLKLWQISWNMRGIYSDVFVHMNPEYVAVSGWLWRLLGKQVGLWYTHGSVSNMLRVAVFFAHHIFTASPESLRINTPKKCVVGHGIHFSTVQKKSYALCTPLRLVTVGRISRVKSLDVVFDACARLMKEIPLTLSVVGVPLTPDDEVYTQELRERASREHIPVTFVGAVNYEDIPNYLVETDIFVSASQTGGLDKVILEALAAGVPVITSNNGARTLLAKSTYECVPHTAEGLLEAMRNLVSMTEKDRGDLARKWSADIRAEYSIESLILNIHRIYHPS